MLSILLIGVSLSMDAFAISVTNGMTLTKPFRIRYAVWMGFYFGGFQFLMPLLGFLLGNGVKGYVEAWGPYISFFLLAFIGGKMIFDSLSPGAEEETGMTALSHPRLLVMAVATSIDALAVGVSFAFMEDFQHLLPSCALIGCTTFILSFAGALIGSRIPGLSSRRAGVVGGVVLVAIGVKLLIEGVFL